MLGTWETWDLLPRQTLLHLLSHWVLPAARTEAGALLFELRDVSGGQAAPAQESCSPLQGVPVQSHSPPGLADPTPHNLLQPGFHPSWPLCGKRGLITHLPLFAGSTQVSVFECFPCHVPPGPRVVGHRDRCEGQGGGRRLPSAPVLVGVITLGWHRMITRAPSCRHRGV